MNKPIKSWKQTQNPLKWIVETEMSLDELKHACEEWIFSAILLPEVKPTGLWPNKFFMIFKAAIASDKLVERFKDYNNTLMLATPRFNGEPIHLGVIETKTTVKPDGLKKPIWSMNDEDKTEAKIVSISDESSKQIRNRISQFLIFDKGDKNPHYSSCCMGYGFELRFSEPVLDQDNGKAREKVRDTISEACRQCCPPWIGSSRVDLTFYEIWPEKDLVSIEILPDISCRRCKWPSETMAKETRNMCLQKVIELFNGKSAYPTEIKIAKTCEKPDGLKKPATNSLDWLVEYAAPGYLTERFFVADDTARYMLIAFQRNARAWVNNDCYHAKYTTCIKNIKTGKKLWPKETPKDLWSISYKSAQTNDITFIRNTKAYAEDVIRRATEPGCGMIGISNFEKTVNDAAFVNSIKVFNEKNERVWPNKIWKAVTLLGEEDLSEKKAKCLLDICRSSALTTRVKGIFDRGDIFVSDVDKVIDPDGKIFYDKEKMKRLDKLSEAFAKSEDEAWTPVAKTFAKMVSDIANGLLSNEKASEILDGLLNPGIKIDKTTPSIKITKEEGSSIKLANPLSKKCGLRSRAK